MPAAHQKHEPERFARNEYFGRAKPSSTGYFGKSSGKVYDRFVGTRLEEAGEGVEMDINLESLPMGERTTELAPSEKVSQDDQQAYLLAFA